MTVGTLVWALVIIMTGIITIIYMIINWRKIIGGLWEIACFISVAVLILCGIEYIDKSIWEFIKHFWGWMIGAIIGGIGVYIFREDIVR